MPNENISTPRTDAFFKEYNLSNLSPVGDFARTLERELSEARQQNDKLVNQLAEFENPLHTCGKDCQRPMCVMRRHCAELAALNERLRKALKSLGGLAINPMPGGVWPKLRDEPEYKQALSLPPSTALEEYMKPWVEFVRTAANTHVTLEDFDELIELHKQAHRLLKDHSL